jgi:tetratricopeptide (TPR) repeat protein
MMSCIFVLYISVFASLGAAAPTVRVGPASGDPDVLYVAREDVTKAQRAEAIWAERLQHDAKDFDSAWKLARARYWLGGRGAQGDRKALLEAGIEAGRHAAELEPGRPEGHFWIAANMGALAESFGLRQGLRFRGEIRDTLQRVLKIDPAFQQGSADRALGRWYFKVPGLFGGSNKRSEEHLRRALTYGPESTISHFFLAETLLAMDRKTEAIQHLEKVLEAPLDPDWAPEDREYKSKAQRLLQTLRQRL